MAAADTTWKVARDGALVGNYTLLQLQRHLASGEVVGTDLAQSNTMDEWLPVADLFTNSPMRDGATHANHAARLYLNPPDLLWWVALIFGFLTLGAFFVVWDVVEAAWLRRVERSSAPLVLYGLALLLFVANLPAQFASINQALFNGPLVESYFGLLFGLGAFLLRLFARFLLRSELLRHFNHAEPLGLRLHWFWTLLFGGLYFQYHFNCINRKKRDLRVSVP